MLIWKTYTDAILTSVNILISYHDQLIKKYINLLRALKQQLRKHWVNMICFTAKKKVRRRTKTDFGIFYWLPVFGLASLEDSDRLLRI